MGTLEIVINNPSCRSHLGHFPDQQVYVNESAGHLGHGLYTFDPISTQLCVHTCVCVWVYVCMCIYVHVH